jgi:hypothetical protein
MLCVHANSIEMIFLNIYRGAREREKSNVKIGKANGKMGLGTLQEREKLLKMGRNNVKFCIKRQ